MSVSFIGLLFFVGFGLGSVSCGVLMVWVFRVVVGWFFLGIFCVFLGVVLRFVF